MRVHSIAVDLVKVVEVDWENAFVSAAEPLRVLRCGNHVRRLLPFSYAGICEESSDEGEATHQVSIFLEVMHVHAFVKRVQLIHITRSAGFCRLLMRVSDVLFSSGEESSACTVGLLTLKWRKGASALSPFNIL